MKITSGGYEAVYYGRVFAHGMSPIRIVLSEERDPLTFEFCIEQEPERDDFITDIRLVRYNEVRIACVNFPRGKPTGNRDMIHLGVLDNRSLSLRYEVTVNGDATSWSLTFTFFSGEGVADDE